jgi:hypothetical protein
MPDASTLVEGQLKNALNEFIQTEETFVQRLITAYNVFVLGSINILPEADRIKIFSNLEEIFTTNDNLLRELREWNSRAGSVAQFAELFLDSLSKFSVYLVYCRGQQAAVRFLQEKLNDPDFLSFIQSRMSDPDCRGLDLGSFLLEPVQRITRYPLLLKQIQKCLCPESGEYSLVSLAISESQNLLDRVNKAMLDAENQLQVLSVQRRLSASHRRFSRSFDFGMREHRRELPTSKLPENFAGLTRALDERQLLKSGLWTKLKSRRPLLVYLFSDFLLLAESASGTTTAALLDDENAKLVIYRAPIPLDSIWLVKEGSLAAASTNACNLENSRVLELEAQDCQTLLVSIAASEFDSWIESIATAKRSLRSRKNDAGTPTKSAGSYTGTLEISVKTALNLQARPDATIYCTVKVDGSSQVFETEKVAADNPHWSRLFNLQIPSIDSAIVIELLKYESLRINGMLVGTRTSHQLIRI